jgi:opacity protein-like surface antigen
MKKMAVIGLAVLMASTSAFSFIVLEAKGQYFSPSERYFRDIYGAGWMAEGEIGIRLFRGLELWAGGGYFSRKGQLTFTREETTLTILPVGGGLRYRITSGKISGYVGAGVNYYQYKESNPIGDVSKKSAGFVVKAGVFFRIVPGLLLDLNLGYTYCKMTPADFEINIGGIAAGAGLAIEF